MIHLSVKKKNEDIEPFDRNKLEKAVKLALHKRPIDQEKIERVLNSIVRQLEVLGDTEVEARVIGEMIMDVLKDLDPVAYIRFASIYKEFKLAEDFADLEIQAATKKGPEKQSLSEADKNFFREMMREERIKEADKGFDALMQPEIEREKARKQRIKDADEAFDAIIKSEKKHEKVMRDLEELFGEEGEGE
ncbi:uncharacterized protein LOC111320219 [Stylophora pistillata]|uniref:uncharacterized protein LOC111320219 n=1 Tax=Stylophora pistillata TaxID=50429 RepID=UPI000C03E387|nr:uncharacterized protein LOC111320219 [Stylophora pistillata]